MITNRLELALERLRSSDWERFEKIAAIFLAVEFDGLRTIAAPQGDDGRDGELFSPIGESSVVLQYSVASNWEDKIRRTAARLLQTLPDATSLIFASNQRIGAAADEIRRRLRTTQGLALDIRDRTWFVERVLGNLAREKAAEELAEVIVDPFLAEAGVTSTPPSDLSSPEAVAALTMLGLQWRDDARDKGLTKLAFDGLVRSVLSATDSDHRMHRSAVHGAVRGLLPGHSEESLSVLVDASLGRLTKRPIRHWTKDDEFCLSHDEHLRITEFKTNSALADAALAVAIESLCRQVLALNGISEAHLSAVAMAVKCATEAHLFERSQAFAMEVGRGAIGAPANDDFAAVLQAEVSRAAFPRLAGVDWIEVLRVGVRELLESSEPAVQAHMRTLKDAYTLFAFLRHTPDVQRVVQKMFSFGQVWIDASIALPLVAETLSEGSAARFTRTIRAATDAGLELFVTDGVVEEVERHMNLALSYARMVHGAWQGRIPYLIERYAISGRSLSAFGGWLERFRGEARPEDDIREYLKGEFGIASRSLVAESEAAPNELRYALQAIWHEQKRRRRERSGSIIDEGAIDRLVAHDIECYCGVVQLRKQERASPFGYSAWWLTLDRGAFDLEAKLHSYLNVRPPDSPVLSADFLLNYLAFGPLRKRVGKERSQELPLLIDFSTIRYLTPELLDEAEQVRNEMKDVPDRIKRRRVRDLLDRARRTLGPIARRGLGDLKDEAL